MKLITFIDEGDVQNVGILITDKEFIKVVDLIENFKQTFPEVPLKETLTMLDVINLGDDFIRKMSKVIKSLKEDKLKDLKKSLDDYKLLAPLPRPPIIYALARNYRGHAEEVGLTTPREPAVFIKAPTSVIGPNEYIIYPSFAKRVDYEAELAVVIGKRGKNIPKEKAMDYVFGYTCFNDITARDLQLRNMEEDLPWDLTKSIDTFAPLGPCIVTKDQIPDPHNLKIELRVNGVVRQSSNTKCMVFKIPEIIEYISRFATLEPGTIIATGTPEGIGELKPGDIVEVEIEGIGVLRNKVVGE